VRAAVSGISLDHGIFEAGYCGAMSDYPSSPPPVDADRDTAYEEVPDPEAAVDDPELHPPREDADREVTGYDEFQEENATTSLDQPSEDLE
jgi:hypothetical protein